MTQVIVVPYDASEPDVTGLGSFRSPALPPPPQGGTSEAKAPHQVSALLVPTGIPLIDRLGRTLCVLRDHEWRCLHERGGLIELQFSRRQVLLRVRLLNGVSLAAINAVLRVGLRGHIPIPPPYVVRVQHQGGQTWEHHRQRCEAAKTPRWVR